MKIKAPTRCAFLDVSDQARLFSERVKPELGPVRRPTRDSVTPQSDVSAIWAFRTFLPKPDPTIRGIVESKSLLLS